jgi:hypothetical protein
MVGETQALGSNERDAEKALKAKNATKEVKRTFLTLCLLKGRTPQGVCDYLLHLKRWWAGESSKWMQIRVGEQAYLLRYHQERNSRFSTSNYEAEPSYNLDQT